MLETFFAFGLGAGILFILLLTGIAALAIFLFIFWILMLVDCATRKFKNETDKVIWILIIVFLHLLGAVIYYFIVKRANKH